MSKGFKKERVFLVKRNHVLSTIEVLEDLGIKKYTHKLLWVGKNDAEESTWAFTVRVNDEMLDRMLNDLSEYKVKILACVWPK